MGKYFMMSTLFNKQSAIDFGLIEKEGETALLPSDNSIWKKRALYDFGWGKENGYVRLPMQNFENLLSLALYSKDKEDRFGAAAIILDLFPEELLCECERYMADPERLKEFKRLITLFELEKPINRSLTLGKTYGQIAEDYARWKKVSQVARKKRAKKFKW